RDLIVTGVQTCALPIYVRPHGHDSEGVRQRLYDVVPLDERRHRRQGDRQERRERQRDGAGGALAEGPGPARRGGCGGRLSVRRRSEERRVGKEWTQGGW